MNFENSSRSLLAAYVEAHNRVIRERSGSAIQALCSVFAPLAVVEFVGIPAPTLRGRDAIAAAFRTNPPDDEIVLGPVVVEDGNARAPHRWMKEAPGRWSGTYRMES